MTHQRSNAPDAKGPSRGTTKGFSNAHALGRAHCEEFLSEARSRPENPFERGTKDANAYWMGWHKRMGERPGWVSNDNGTEVPPERYMADTPQRIPIGALADLAVKHKGTQAILLLHDAEDNDHIVTWGKATEQCENAANIGNQLKDLLGWPECTKTTPRRVQFLEEQALKLVEAEKRLDRLKRKVMAQIEQALGVTAENVTEESAAKVLAVYRAWEQVDP